EGSGAMAWGGEGSGGAAVVAQPASRSNHGARAARRARRVWTGIGPAEPSVPRGPPGKLQSVMAETEWVDRKIAPQSRPGPRSEEGAGVGSRDRRATQGRDGRAR